MRTATSNLIVLEAEIVDSKIIGTAIDGDIKVWFAVANSEVNQRLFVTEANLVVTGKFRLGREICTIGIWITSVIAIAALPDPVTAEIEVPAEFAEVELLEIAAGVEVPVTATKQKRAARSKQAKAETELACV
jgi:hypothetical protein